MSIAKIIAENTGLTYYQQVKEMAALGESTDDTIKYNPEYLQAKEDHCLCDLNEGVLPYRPRYIAPDYRVLFERGSKFLDLQPPKDIWDAVNALMIMYHHVPSITTFPVYIGDLDTLLEPFVKDYQEAKKAIGYLLKHVDKTLTDSFVHANIGPFETKAGQIILELTEEMQLAVPNMSIRYDQSKTSLEFAGMAAKCMLKTAKPSFANDKMYRSDMGEYVVASCYNVFKIGGGGYSLPRMILANIANKAKNVDDFFDKVLPHYIDLQLEFLDLRVKYLVEEAAFFKSSFLVKEGFLNPDNFFGMFGLVGLAECSNNLLKITDKNKGFGHNQEADKLAEKILDFIEDRVAKHQAPYGQDNRYYLHAQVGIDSDGGQAAPGVRIPIGYEPDFAVQMLHSTTFHKHFVSGVGDVFKFDHTWLNNIEALLDVINGAFDLGTRYISGYLEDGDVVRVTGYLVKKSEIAKLDEGLAVLNQATVFGQGARDGAKALDRKVNHESTD
ncbi:MAG: YjjI family glycine radical enzyme [Erysipelotrichaceae bacterium]